MGRAVSGAYGTSYRGTGTGWDLGLTNRRAEGGDSKIENPQSTIGTGAGIPPSPIPNPRSKIRNPRVLVLAAVLAVAAFVLLVAPTLAGKPPAAPGADAAAAAPAADDEKDTAAALVDEGQRLLSEAERARGATYPGRDPAYLVLPRPAVRQELARDLMTATVRTMIDRMMHYVLVSQSADGSWSDDDYESNTGVSGLCCLAIMAGGDRPNIGANGKALTIGIEFLLKSAKSGGAITGQTSNAVGPMYEQCYATLALLYAYGNMPWRRDLRTVISKSIQIIERSQKLDGGWRYNFTREGDSDVSVTCNVLWVLRMGKKCGFTVNAEKIRQGVAFIERCGLPEGGFRYRINGRKMAASMGGAGIIVLCGNGNLEHPMIEPTRDRIAYHYRRLTIPDLKDLRFTVFNTFYASLACYMCGDDYWVPFYRKAVRLYSAMQRRDGEVWDKSGNTVYPTAMAAIVLQAPLGYLPIYER